MIAPSGKLKRSTFVWELKGVSDVSVGLRSIFVLLSKIISLKYIN